MIARATARVAPTIDVDVSNRLLGIVGATLAVALEVNQPAAKHRLYTGCQHHLSFSQALGKIADHIDIRITETFGFLANERAPARYVLNNLTALCLGQTTIHLRTSWELIETLQRHARASQKHRAYRILSRELCHLRGKKGDAFDHVMVC